MPSTRSSFLFASLTCAAILAACAPAAPAGGARSAGTGSSRETANDGAHGAVHDGRAADEPAKRAPGPMNPPVATSMTAELAALGLDAANLPPLDKLQGDKLRRVMKLFTRSLGVRCSGCHTEDFAASTTNKRIATKMWDELARGLVMKDGAPIFCDSCHQGHAEILDKRDGEALAAWMKDAYVQRLARRDGAPHACVSCHGEPFVGDILDAWAEKKLPPGAGTGAVRSGGAATSPATNPGTAPGGRPPKT